MKPTLNVNRTSETGIEMYRLVISGGTDPGLAVLNDFLAVVAIHGLTPQGGCFNVMAIDDKGNTQEFLGGMYVQIGKYPEVSKQLKELGYTLELSGESQ